MSRRDRYTKKDWLELLMMFVFLVLAVVVLSLVGTLVAMLIATAVVLG